MSALVIPININHPVVVTDRFVKLAELLDNAVDEAIATFNKQEAEQKYPPATPQRDCRRSSPPRDWSMTYVNASECARQRSGCRLASNIPMISLRTCVQALSHCG